MFDDQLAPPTPPPSTAPAEHTPHRALYLRWRPTRFADVVGQEHVTRTLRNAVKAGRPAHAYLFTGPRGTGKTSVARILYRAANCTQGVDGDPCNTCPLCRAALEGRNLDLVEIDAASNRGIDDIRDLRDKVAYRPGEGRYRVYIVDEAHELTPAAWDAFLKTLEEPPPHAIFVLATTDAHKVPATIVSRCQRFDFRRIPFQATREQLARVAELEGLDIAPEVCERLALVARGGLRDALSLLDQLAAFAGGRVDLETARAALSLPSIEAVRGAIDGMTRRDPGAVMTVLADATEGGADLRLFAEELITHLRALLLLRTGADARLSDELPVAEVEWLRARAPEWTVGTLIRLVQTLSEALARTRDAAQFQVQTEVALLIAADAERVAPAPGALRPAAAVSAAGTRPLDPEPTAPISDAAGSSTSRSRGAANAGSGPVPAATPTGPAGPSPGEPLPVETPAPEASSPGNGAPNEAAASQRRTAASPPPAGTAPPIAGASNALGSDRAEPRGGGSGHQAAASDDPFADEPEWPTEDSAVFDDDGGPPSRGSGATTRRATSDRQATDSSDAPMSAIDEGTVAAVSAGPTGDDGRGLVRADALASAPGALEPGTSRPKVPESGATDQSSGGAGQMEAMGTGPDAPASGGVGAGEGPIAPGPADGGGAAELRARWPDVVDQVKSRNSLLGSSLGSAQPVGLDGNVLSVAFGTEFNRKSAERTSNRQQIEAAFQRVYGSAYRLRAIVASETQPGLSLLDDPVINFAARTFGGQPKRVSSDQEDL